VQVVGDVDSFGTKRLTSALKAAVKRGEGGVIVSFERATLFESTLLKELIHVGQVLAADRRRLLIVLPRRYSDRLIFRLLNLDRMFECFESQDEASISARSADAQTPSALSDPARAQAMSHGRV
jgi:anti-anti-sigma regulatory factor